MNVNVVFWGKKSWNYYWGFVGLSSGDDIMSDVLEEFELLNCLMCLKIIQLPYHIGS